MKQTSPAYLACTFLAALLMVDPAYAYLDPGLGSILLQGLIAAVAGALATVGIYWSKLKSFYLGYKQRHSQRTSDDE